MLRDIMAYIATHHPDAAPFIGEDMAWHEASATKAPGYSSVTYTAAQWNVTIAHTMTPESAYEVEARYRSDRIVWQGLVKDGAIIEHKYTSH